MVEAIYALCALTSLACAVLLVRSWRRTKTTLLGWSSVCFIGFFVNNVLLFLDFVIVPGSDLAFPRALTAFVSATALLVGLIWSSR